MPTTNPSWIRRLSFSGSLGLDQGNRGLANGLWQPGPSRDHSLQISVKRRQETTIRTARMQREGARICRNRSRTLNLAHKRTRVRFPPPPRDWTTTGPVPGTVVEGDPVKRLAFAKYAGVSSDLLYEL